MPQRENLLKTFVIPDSMRMERLDLCLAALDGTFSRSRAQKLIKDGLVKVDGSVCLFSKVKMSPGQTLTVEVPPLEAAPVQAEPEKIPLKVIFEDDWFIAINKAAGMVVHPAAGNWTGTVVNAILGREPELAEDFEGEAMRPGIVHRLDKDTSGCLVVAKTPESHFRISRSFSERRVSKTYMAIVCGWPRSREGEIETLIGRNPVDRKRMAVLRSRGREAVTLYKVVRQGEIKGMKASLLEVRILTGRTHQIRVHMAHIGHPVVGDSLYGGVKGIPAKRQMLHAWKLAFPHPEDRHEVKLRAPYPSDFKRMMSKLEPFEEA